MSWSEARRLRRLSVVLSCVVSTVSLAQEATVDAGSPPVEVAPVVEAAPVPSDSAEGWGDFAGAAAPKIFEGRLYGYIDSYFENTFGAPTGLLDAAGKPAYNEGGWEWDVLNLHVMAQGSIYGKYRYFVNMVARSAGAMGTDQFVRIRNAWVEAPIFGSALQVRVGKTYRRFGLYNEILDAVPTFIGIEPPELFDSDHLMLTRTTNAMVHGSFSFPKVTLSYSVNVGNDERIDKAFPIGGDLRMDYSGILLAGTSFYWSGGPAQSAQGVGDGPPTGGVATWMKQDNYFVTGAFAQLNYKRLQVQAEYWYAGHDAQRDPAAVAQLAAGNLTSWQLQRYFVDGDPNNGPTSAAVKYAVQTFYVRAGYQIALTEEATLTPYVQFDWYSNPEIIAKKSLGGDNEAGRGDGGRFIKLTAGGVFRPVPQVALKLDYSTHVYDVSKQIALEHEVRASLSYLWEVQQ
jgi:hypothetical protein